MGVSVPLKLKDSAGLQSFDSDDYDFLAYRAGLLLRQSDSSDRAGFTRYNPASQNTIFVGGFTNTEFDSDIGIGGDTSLLSTTTIYSEIRRNAGTDSVGTRETYDDSNYVNLFYQTDSANDSGSQLKLKAFVNSDWNVLTDEILSRIYKYDYVGSIRLASNVTDFDSANGGWSTILSNVFTDTRTSDSAGNRDSDDVVYNLFQKVDMTGIGVPSDSSRPFTFKRRIDSAEIDIAGRFDRIGEDSDKLTSVYYPTSSGIIGNATRNRTAIGLSTDNNGDISNLRLALNQEWFDKIVGVHPLVPSTVDAPTLKRGTNGQRTEFSSPVTGGDTLSNGPFTVDRDSGNQTWFGIKATVDLVDSARFGDLSATFASTDTVMQQHANSDGTFSFQFDFPANTRFELNKIKDDGSVLDSSADRFFYQRTEGASSPDDATANKLVATARAGRNWLVFSGANGTVFTDSDHQLVPDSDTKVLLGRMKFNNRFANLTNSLDLTLDSDTDIIGGDSADNISLILKNDFQGLQLADSDNLDETLGTRIRNRLISSDVVGAATVLSAAEGNPLQNGFTGTWISKGTATDTRKALVDTNYTRTRVSTYARLRTSSYTTEFSDTYQAIRTSNYSDGYIGNYSRNFTRTRTSNFTRASTRTSTYAAFGGNFTGNFVGSVAGSNTITPPNQTLNNDNADTNPDSSQVQFASISDGWRTSETSNESASWVSMTNATAPTANVVGTELNITNICRGGDVKFTPNQYATHINVTCYIIPGWSSNVYTYSPQFRWVQEDAGGTLRVISGVATVNALPNNTGGWATSSANPASFTTTTGNQGRAYCNWTASGSGSATNPSAAGRLTPVHPTNPCIMQMRFGRGNSRPRGYAIGKMTITQTLSTPVDYTRISTRTSTRNSLLSFTGDYTRDFTGNYTGEFTRTRPAFFSRSFEGNYTGNYSRNFVGNYGGNFVGTAQANALSVLGTQTFVQAPANGTSAGLSPVFNYTFTLNVPANTKSIIISGGVGTNGSRQTRFSKMTIASSTMLEARSANSNLAEYTFDSAIFARNFSSTGSQTLTVGMTNHAQVYGFGLRVLYLNKAFSSDSQITSPDSWATIFNVTTTIGSFSGTGGTPNFVHYNGGIQVATATIYDAPNHSAGIGTLDGNGNVVSYPSVVSLAHSGNRDSIHGYRQQGGSSTTTGIDVAARRFRNDFGETGVWVSWTPGSFTNLTQTYTRTSLRTRSSAYSANYARTRTSTYQAGQNFSRDFQGDYVGNYIGNFTRNFIGNYSRNFTGDFTGVAIGSSNETIETYTLYVKVG